MTTLIAIEADALNEVLTELRGLRDEVRALKGQSAPEWVSLKEYAAMHKVNVRTVYNHARAGRIETRGEGKLRMVRVK